MESERLLESLVDPITYQVFTDPVIASDGHTYERSSIVDWLAWCREQGRELTSPLTREVVSDVLQNNLVVRQLVEELRQLETSFAQAQSTHGEGRWQDASFMSVRSQDIFDVPAAVLSRISMAQMRERTESKADEEASLHSSAALGTVASLTALTPIFQAVDPLRDLLDELDWQPPQIVVMGNENSGKSTIMERICMMPLFPTDKRICTRMVIKVCLRRGEPQPPLLEVREVATNEVVRSQPMAMDAAAACIDEWMREEVQRENGGAMSGVCRSRMLVVHVQSSTTPNLDLVDLPGLVEAHVHGEPDDMKEQTRQLVEEYLDRFTQHSLFLVTVPATAGPNQSIAMDIVQRRKLQEFAIGVLTKADLVLFRDADDDDDDDAKSRAEELRSKLDQKSGDVVPLHPFGYVATMNKQAKQRRRCRYDDLVDQAMREWRWFESKGFGSDPRTSVAALVTRLTHMYHEYVVNTWLPGAVNTIQAEIDRLRLRENDFGFPRAHDLAFVDPAGLSEEAHSRFKQLLDTAALATLCTRMHAEVLKNGQLFETTTEAQPIWTLAPWLRLLAERGIAGTAEVIARCAELSRTFVRTLLASDDSPFRLGRFDRVIGRIDAHLEQVLEDWQGEVQATLIEFIQDYHRLDCTPHITLTHALEVGGATSAAAPVATVRCEVEYSKLNLTVCQLVMEGICRCLLNLRWEHAVPDADDPHTWLESWAAERTELLDRLHKATTAKRWLQELVQEVEATQRQVSLTRLQAATRMEDMRQVAASAQWLAEHLRRLSSKSVCESLCDHDPVRVVHAALERADAAGTNGNDALPALLQCMRWLCNYGSNDSDLRESAVLANLERACELKTVQQVCTVLLRESPAVASAALECMTILSTTPDLARTICDDEDLELAIQALDRHLDNPGVAEHGCRLVSMFSPNGASAERLIRAGVCETVVRALDQHSEVTEVMHWACRAIVTLFEVRNDDIAARLQATAVQEVIARVLQQHAGGGEALRWACRARSHLQAHHRSLLRQHVFHSAS